MADRKTRQSRPKTGLLTEELEPGKARCFTNLDAFRAEKDLHLFRDGVESTWPLDSPCSHDLGPYGWISDMILSGYGCRRHKGEIYLYRECNEPGDTEWKWS